jgi:hypothetical protein
VFRIEGSRAVDMLAKDMSLDLHPRAFAVGRCSSTRFAQTLVTIDRPSHFLVYADVSFAVHLDRWFREAAVEFQIQAVSPRSTSFSSSSLSCVVPTGRASSPPMVELGQEVECQVLGRAFSAHLEHRVVLNGGKTVVFS